MAIRLTPEYLNKALKQMKEATNKDYYEYLSQVDARNLKHTLNYESWKAGFLSGMVIFKQKVILDKSMEDMRNDS